MSTGYWNRPLHRPIQTWQEISAWYNLPIRAKLISQFRPEYHPITLLSTVLDSSHWGLLIYVTPGWNDAIYEKICYQIELHWGSGFGGHAPQCVLPPVWYMPPTVRSWFHIRVMISHYLFSMLIVQSSTSMLNYQSFYKISMFNVLLILVLWSLSKTQDVELWRLMRLKMMWTSFWFDGAATSWTFPNCHYNRVW